MKLDVQLDRHEKSKYKTKLQKDVAFLSRIVWFYLLENKIRYKIFVIPNIKSVKV